MLTLLLVFSARGLWVTALVARNLRFSSPQLTLCCHLEMDEKDSRDVQPRFPRPQTASALAEVSSFHRGRSSSHSPHFCFFGDANNRSPLEEFRKQTKPTGATHGQSMLITVFSPAVASLQLKLIFADHNLTDSRATKSTNGNYKVITLFAGLILIIAAMIITCIN